MTQLLVDIWPILLTALLGVIIGYARYVHKLQERAAVLENTLKEHRKEIDSLQKRMDSHSKKQDDILERIGSMEKEVLKQMGAMGATISSLSSDLKGLSNLLAVSDVGIRINRA